MSYRIPCASVGRPRVRLVADVRASGTNWFRRVKGVTDVAIALVLLAATAPAILALIALVRLTSRGPAIFRQTRVGRGGRSFSLYKIRTMRHDCERLTGPQWAKSNDSRVTPLGRFLRKSHLDELPQLWNVVRGEMSLVGPRPERPEFVARLEIEVPGYAGRLAVHPGITGLAQVQLPPDSDVDDVRRKVACDLCYIREMGPALDLKILVGTLLKVVGVPFEVTRRVLDLPGCPGRVQGGVGSRLGESSISQLQSA